MQESFSKESEELLPDDVTLAEGNNKNELGNSDDIETNVEEPKVGMIFNTDENLFQYYKRYGIKMGFEITRRSSNKGIDGELKYVTFACSRSRKSRSVSRNILKLPPTIKTDCKAKVNASVCSDETWMIHSIELEHNHKLSTPGKVRYFKTNRAIDPHVKRQLEVNDRAGIRPYKSYKSFAIEAGGHDNLSFLEKDCRNYLDKIRRLWLGEGDANAIQKYFLKMQSDNSNFFYTMDLYEEGRLKNVFWADARSRAVYKEFGDVITFDSTYLTNKYDMPFVAFVGVNHHGQSILFGCGLISNEDIEKYVWLFNSWLTCMFYRAPMAIITNQDKAMQKAIEIVFANARHRWCLWHIMKKLPEKLRRYKQYEEIKFALQNIVYDSLTNSDFENRWNYFIEKYDLHSNEWLLGLYDERQRWVPTFLKDTFWAGMSTTQRSESMHAFFDGFVNSKITLKQFVEQYENALRDKVEKENHADFSSLNSHIPCMTHYPIEKQFQDTYTKEKFREFQHELSAKLYCEVSLKKENVPYLEFTVAENVKVGNNIPTVDFTIWLNEAECEINCICRLFEFKGILCRHVIAMLIHKKMFCVPSKYILRRWRKDVNRCHTKVNIGYDNWNTKPEGRRFD